MSFRLVALLPKLLVSKSSYAQGHWVSPPSHSFWLMKNLSPKDIAGSDIMKLNASHHMKSLGGGQEKGLESPDH